ncbi:MAG: hypothetical protein CL966_00445 [Euryarchaeota archaeon]|nr:hypothetical protein [Euryarchaeota archaeon]
MVLRDAGDWMGLVLATCLKGIRAYRQNEWNTMSFSPFFHRIGTEDPDFAQSFALSFYNIWAY